MNSLITSYLKKRSIHEAWPLECDDTSGVDQIAVIPALAESEWLFDTLGDLAAQPDGEKERFFVAVVINNRADAPDAEQADNASTLARLREGECGAGLRLGIIDAASPGRELPEGEGVGLARKIGMDHALAILSANKTDGRIISLDADTRIERDYFESIRTAFSAAPEIHAALIDYAHQRQPEVAVRDAVTAYETWMRAHELGLAYAGSPYAYTATGSNIACTASGYATAGGMNRRQAGEDFYFVQQLARTGTVGRIHSTTVHPSGRISSRTPFGTGPRIRDHLAEGKGSWHLYHPESYIVLRHWMGAVADNHGRPGHELSRIAGDIHPELKTFLDNNAFEGMWERFQQNSADAKQLMRLFHGWFDGLRTLRLLHHLRDHGLPEQVLYDALDQLAAYCDFESRYRASAPPEDILDWLRATGRKVLYDFGLSIMDRWVS